MSDYDRERSRRADHVSERDYNRSLGRDERDRDRSPPPSKHKKGSSERLVYVSNIPYDFRWQELKDLFRSEVGEVAYVELFMDEKDKSRGCGIVEFETADSAAKAVQKMHRYELKGRKIVVKDSDPVMEREKAKGARTSGGSSKIPRLDQIETKSAPKWGETYGLSPAFLESLGITGPLITKVFVANLDYKVDEKKVREVFRLAGRVISVEIATDKDGKSRGFGTVEFDHPVEAVQAISMLHNQMLYDRRINVRMDKSSERTDGPLKLPDGLKGIGMGLGTNGAPLTDIPRNLPSVSGSGSMKNQQPPPPPNPLTNTSPSSALAALSTAALATFGQSQLGSLNSQLDSRLLDTALARRQLEMLTSQLSSGTNNDLGLRSSTLTSSYAPTTQLTGTTLGTTPTRSLLDSFGSRDYETLSGLTGTGTSGGNYTDYEFRSVTGSITDRSATVGSSLTRATDTILVSNLPTGTTWQILRDKFRDFGDIKYVEMKNADTGIVRFSTQREAERAITLLDRTRMEGRIIDVTPY